MHDVAKAEIVSIDENANFPLCDSHQRLNHGLATLHRTHG